MNKEGVDLKSFTKGFLSFVTELCSFVFGYLLYIYFSIYGLMIISGTNYRDMHFVLVFGYAIYLLIPVIIFFIFNGMVIPNQTKRHIYRTVPMCLLVIHVLIAIVVALFFIYIPIPMGR